MQDPNLELLNLISLVSGILLSLVLAYFPKVRVWYGSLNPELKGLIAAGLSAVAAAILWTLSCVPVSGEPLWPVMGCADANVRELIYAVFYAVAGNIGTYVTVTKNKLPEDVRAAKELRDGVLR